MKKKYYAVKLIAPRPDFVQTMTDDEKALMQQHAAYWQEHLEKGMVVVFGPVFDPKGPYGLGIVSVDDEQQLKKFIDNDPSLPFNKIEYYEMMATMR